MPSLMLNDWGFQATRMDEGVWNNYWIEARPVECSRSE